MREYKLDNLKFFLIFCVVFGHKLELFHAGGLYKVIYFFHMPAFVFLSGYIAKFRPKKIVTSLICPYVFFSGVLSLV